MTTFNVWQCLLYLRCDVERRLSPLILPKLAKMYYRRLRCIGRYERFVQRPRRWEPTSAWSELYLNQQIRDIY